MNAIFDAESITSMLSFVSPEERDTWFKVAMAVKSELGEDGHLVWDEWSQRGSNYNRKSARAVWKSIKSTGGVSIGSLVFLAKQAGWKPDQPIQQLSQEELLCRKQEREQAEQAAQVAQELERKRARAKTKHILSHSVIESADFAYLVNKQIKPSGARFYKGSIVLPLYDVHGELHSCQLIRSDGTKMFLKGGRTKGVFYALSEIDADGVVYIAEGFSTAATIQEWKQQPTIAALNAGNLLPVALAVRKKNPRVKIVLCADNDRFNKSGNVGKEKAEEAARIVGGSVLLPEFPKGSTGTDWNDLYIENGGCLP